MATVDLNTEKTNDENKSDEDDDDKEKGASANFECNICLDTAKDAVISMCGHLFCWPCLHQWLETRHSNPTCPVCKAAISKDKVIPLYGRGSSNQEDPREKLPPRPPGQRTEPEPQHGFMPGFNFGDGEGFQFHFGIGAFPFGIFTSFNNLGLGGGGHGQGMNLPPGQMTQQMRDERFLSSVFMGMAVIFLLWLIWV